MEMNITDYVISHIQEMVESRKFSKFKIQILHRTFSNLTTMLLTGTLKELSKQHTHIC